MIMTCREVVEVLMAFVCGELPADHEGRVQEHLGTCADCAAYKETYELTIVVSRKLSCHALPASCEQRLRASLEKELGRRLDAPGIA